MSQEKSEALQGVLRAIKEIEKHERRERLRQEVVYWSLTGILAAFGVASIGVALYSAAWLVKQATLLASGN
jgi:hypothetical protein